MRVSFFPSSSRWDVNPSLFLLRRALTAQGVTLVQPPRDGLSARWLWRQRKTVDLLHFHWIQYHYRSSGKSGSLFSLVRFAIRLLFARLLGYGIVWTLHNILPHERAKGRLDEWARWLMVWLSHQILVYCEAGRDELHRLFRRRHGVWVTSRGAYTELAWEEIASEDARRSLGLSQALFVYFYFGTIRPYKRVPDLIRAFRQLPGNHLRLLLAGEIQDSAIGAELEPLLAADARIIAEFGYASDERLGLLLAAADVVVLPFGEILSSGSALLALSCGRPVLAPALGCLPEWITPDCGLLYAPDDSDGLQRAMLTVQTIDIPAMQRAALARAGHFGWDAAAQKTLAAYGKALGRQSA